MLVHQMNRLNSPASIVANHDAATFPEIYLKNVSFIFVFNNFNSNILGEHIIIIFSFTLGR